MAETSGNPLLKGLKGSAANFDAFSRVRKASVALLCHQGRALYMENPPPLVIKAPVAKEHTISEFGGGGFADPGFIIVAPTLSTQADD